ncbi:unnamed protein product [Moneuplotes crassus]|uniref:Uncharacterized protein n=1 Tax=Euplotes crassus TaxID=5936 RepID=A0AAD1U9H8_EUPCR|nr:unnamed protein product [Moneuplotes crassus]
MLEDQAYKPNLQVISTTLQLQSQVPKEGTFTVKNHRAGSQTVCCSVATSPKGSNVSNSCITRIVVSRKDKKTLNRGANSENRKPLNSTVNSFYARDKQAQIKMTKADFKSNLRQSRSNIHEIDGEDEHTSFDRFSNFKENTIHRKRSSTYQGLKIFDLSSFVGNNLFHDQRSTNLKIKGIRFAQKRIQIPLQAISHNPKSKKWHKKPLKFDFYQHLKHKSPKPPAFQNYLNATNIQTFMPKTPSKPKPSSLHHAQNSQSPHPKELTKNP